MKHITRKPFYKFFMCKQYCTITFLYKYVLYIFFLHEFKLLYQNLRASKAVTALGSCTECSYFFRNIKQADSVLERKTCSSRMYSYKFNDNKSFSIVPVLHTQFFFFNHHIHLENLEYFRK